MILNDEQKVFIKTLLEDELTRLLIKRSKSQSVKKFDEVCGERIKYIQDLLGEFK